MPTTSETAGRATAAEEDNIDAFDGIYDSLRSGEATGEEAVATTLHAFTDLLRATVPMALSQPARFVDLSFEVVQQTINFERRFVYEVVSGFQRVVTESLADVEVDQAFKGQNGRGADQRSRSAARRAA
jgi:hypothetical protein